MGGTDLWGETDTVLSHCRRLINTALISSLQIIYVSYLAIVNKAIVLRGIFAIEKLTGNTKQIAGKNFAPFWDFYCLHVHVVFLFW